MPKLITYLPQTVITDFSGIFDTPKEERAFLYKNLVESLNKMIGDVFVKRTCFVTKIKDGKQVQEESTLDKIGFESAEIPTNSEWRPKDVSGEFAIYEYPVGERLLVKLKKYCKLQWILNNIAKESVIENLKNDLYDNSSGLTEEQLKTKDESTRKQIDEIQKSIHESCLENYVYATLSRIIFDKIQSEEKEAIDKEQKELEAELEKPLEKPLEN